MRGEISSGKYSKRHPLDWYVDPVWCAAQLALAMDGFWFEHAHGLAIWDPSCGMGNTLHAAHELNLRTIGSDVVDNLAFDQFIQNSGHDSGYIDPEFFIADFLELEHRPAPCSIVCNPPYSYGRRPMAELFARQALKLSSKHVCLLLPSKWLASQGRYDLFTEHPPLAVLHLCQRPSMPPGDMMAAMGERAGRGGMTDYCWIVWDATVPTACGATRTIWLPPLHRNDKIRPIRESR